jgi:hypothetical protein
MDRSLPDF